MIVFIIFISMGPVFAQIEIKMNLYQKGVFNRRIAEARKLWDTMEQDGFTKTTVATLDFTFFSDEKNGADDLVKSLSLHCKTEIAPAKAKGYWLIDGTTGPNGNEFDKEEWLDWVEYMVTLGFSNNSVFSTWSVYDPGTKKTWSSENIDIE